MLGFEPCRAFNPEGSEACLFINNIPIWRRYSTFSVKLRISCLLRDFRVEVKYRLLKKQSSDEH